MSEDGGHFYDDNGNPCHSVIGANGNERPSTWADAKKHGWLPSVNTITKHWHKGSLEQYKMRQVALAGRSMRQEIGEEDWAFANRVVTASRDDANASADRGTEIHAAVERRFKTGQITGDIVADAIADAIINDIVSRFGSLDGIVSELTFADRGLGYGGTIDIAYRDRLFIADLKTRSTRVRKKDGARVFPSPYFHTGLQLAGYAAHIWRDPLAATWVEYDGCRETGAVKIVDWSQTKWDRQALLDSFMRIRDTCFVELNYDPRTVAV